MKDAVSSGFLTLGSSHALVIGLGANLRDAAGDFGAPLPGTGFTALASCWNWKGKEGTSLNPSALLQSAYFTNPGTLAATFTASPNDGFNDNLLGIGVALLGNTPTNATNTATPAPASPIWAGLLLFTLLSLVGLMGRAAAVGPRR